MTVPTPNDPFMFFAEIIAGIPYVNSFTPSSVSVREQRIREQADRTVRQLIDSFPEQDFFPEEGMELVFALLTQLTDWPANIQLKIADVQGQILASYLKGNDVNHVQGYVELIQHIDGDYSGVAADSVDDNNPEQLFRLILSQLPSGSTLGIGGNFPDSSSTAGRIVTIREQMAALAKSERVRLFDAFLADVTQIKSDVQISAANRFLPFWRPQPTYRSSMMNWLQALAPEMSVEWFYALLERSPLSEAQQRVVVEEGTLPESFAWALKLAMEEWRRDRGIDGVLHTRTYNDDSDALARVSAESLLETLLKRKLVILEGAKDLDGAEDKDATDVVLRHNGNGEYSVQDPFNSGIAEFGQGTDSFYRAISSALQPHERQLLGMQGETDVAGLRATIGNIAIDANGGWFDPERPMQVKEQNLPGRMKSASVVDKRIWNDNLQEYVGALMEAQATGLPDISQYGNPEQIREYAREQLKQRLSVDLGLSLDPAQVFVETTESRWTGSPEGPPVGNQAGEGEFEYTTTRRSLIQLCVESIGIEDLDYWITARFVDSNDDRIAGLSKDYVYALVRELNIGKSYTQFLKQRLQLSEQGQWSRDRYAQIMRAQMSLDAIEAKMANDFNSGHLPPDKADRGYKWVKAVLDHPVDDGGRPLVEGHHIQVQQLTINGRSLDGVLIFGPASREAVSSVVLYTPHVKDGIHFHELSGLDQIPSRLAQNPQYLAALEILRNEGVHLVGSSFSATPILGDLFHSTYDYEVRRVLAGVDAQTTSTPEANLNSAWNIACKLADIVIEFAPFRVRLPIAAARSLYAISQGVREVSSGDANAVLHFVQAGLLLADGLPGGKRVKAKTPERYLDPSMALTKVPDGLKLRTDGIYKGVYEHNTPGSFTRFYANDAGKWFSIKYHDGLRSWQVADSRMLNATYRTAVRFNKQGRLVLSPSGAGGGRDKVPKGAKATRSRDRSPDSSSNDSFPATLRGGRNYSGWIRKALSKAESLKRRKRKSRRILRTPSKKPLTDTPWMAEGIFTRPKGGFTLWICLNSEEVPDEAHGA
ncbi:dermonecrotic toxin domain-containing protein [Pseudomonas sp. NA-150]|uniref:dermonecrotic toxin domain-containing protein n=1 Tax=Pseudomonas sp. NA-150 TaxID=3367525 RepID=UPI0037CC5441